MPGTDFDMAVLKCLHHIFERQAAHVKLQMSIAAILAVKMIERVNTSRLMVLGLAYGCQNA